MLDVALRAGLGPTIRTELRSLDGAVINNNFASQAGIDPTTAIYSDLKDTKARPVHQRVGCPAEGKNNPSTLRETSGRQPEAVALTELSPPRLTWSVDTPEALQRVHLASLSVACGLLHLWSQLQDVPASRLALRRHASRSTVR
jgi:hypothetical protein